MIEDNWTFDDPDLPYGWAGEYSNANTIGFELHYQLYSDIVDWINSNIKNPRSNARWTKIGDCIYVQIRKKKDYTWFSLRWQ